MNNAVKKIIAREFLLLILVLFIGLVSYLGVIPYNDYTLKKYNKYYKEIEDKTWLANHLEKQYHLKIRNQSWLKDIVYKTEEISISPRRGGSWLGGYSSVTSELLLFTENEYIEAEKLALSDSIKFAWNNTWAKEKVNYLVSLTFTPESLKSFILRNRINNNDSLKLSQAKSLRNEIDGLQLELKRADDRYFYSHEHYSFVIDSLLFGFAIFFGCRYLFYTIMWSIKTLKQSGE